MTNARRLALAAISLSLLGVLGSIWFLINEGRPDRPLLLDHVGYAAGLITLLLVASPGGTNHVISRAAPWLRLRFDRLMALMGKPRTLHMKFSDDTGISDSFGNVVVTGTGRGWEDDAPDSEKIERLHKMQLATDQRIKILTRSISAVRSDLMGELTDVRAAAERQAREFRESLNEAQIASDRWSSRAIAPALFAATLTTLETDLSQSAFATAAAVTGTIFSTMLAAGPLLPSYWRCAQAGWRVR